MIKRSNPEKHEGSVFCFLLSLSVEPRRANTKVPRFARDDNNSRDDNN